MFWKSRSSAYIKKQPSFRIWKEPVIHFFVLGLVVFGLYAVMEKKPEAAADPFLVEVTSADIEWFRTMWTKRMGREPTVEEMRGMVNQMIREQVLSREAVSLGLDEGDTVVRRRLAQKMDFLFQDLSEITEPTDSEQAIGRIVDAQPHPDGGQLLLAVLQIKVAEAGDLHLGSADGPLLVLQALPYAFEE